GSCCVRQRKYAQQLLSVLVDAIGRNDVAREHGPAERIGDRHQFSALIERLRKIALPFERGRKRLVGNVGRHGKRQELLRPEEEQLVAIVIELRVREQNRTAEEVARVIKTIARARLAVPVIEEFVRVESFVAEKIVGAAVKIVGAVLDDDVDGSTGTAS